MNIHRMARTCPRSRAVLVRRVLQEGRRVVDVAAELGVSRRTVYKWLGRFRAEGFAGLEDRSSRPHRSPKRTNDRVRRRILRYRRHRMTGPQIARRMGLPRSTVARVLRQSGLNRLRNLDPPVVVQRYEKSRPGELVHIDTKKLGRIVGGPGHRVHGDPSRRTRGAGWEYVHVAIDDHTRLAYVEVLDSEGGDAAAGFMERALASLAERGVKVEAVMSDNALAYRRSHRFQSVLESRNIRHVRTRPYTPRTNGKAERLIQTLLREWAYRYPYSTSEERRRALPKWLGYYNHNRPHGSLDGRPPISRLEERA